MRKPLFTIIVIAMFIVFTSNGHAQTFLKDASIPNSTNIQNNGNFNNDSMIDKIRIKIGSSIFTATISGNTTAIAFKRLLPMTINMVELNGNEKYWDLSISLPTNALRPSTIQTGDLMMYGANTLVLFYKTFSTSFSYTKLGHVDDPAGLANALGSGNVTVTFELL